MKLRTTLGIEAHPGQLRLCEVAAERSGPRVVRADTLHIDLGQPEIAGEALRRLLASGGYEARSARVVLFHPDLEVHFRAVPPMSRAELKAVMSREAARLGQRTGERLEVADTVLGPLPATTVAPLQLMWVAYPREMVTSALDLFQRAAVQLELLTVLPIGITMLLEGSRVGASGALAWIHFSFDRASISVFHGGRLLLTRQFLVPPPAPVPDLFETDLGLEVPEPHEADVSTVTEAESNVSSEALERAVTELQRSLRYVRQQHASLSVDRVFASGTGALPVGWAEEVGAEVGAAVEWIGALEGVQMDGAPYAAYGVAAAAATHAKPKALLDLVPRPIRHRQTIRAARVATALVASLLAAFFWMGVARLEREAHAVRDQKATGQAMLRAREARLEQLRTIKEARGKGQAAEVLLDADRREGKLLYVTLRTLSVLAPPGTTFDALEIRRRETERGTVGFAAELRGEVRTRRADTTQQGFNRFYDLLQAVPFVKDIALPEVRMMDARPENLQGESRASGEAVLRFRLAFALPEMPLAARGRTYAAHR